MVAPHARLTSVFLALAIVGAGRQVAAQNPVCPPRTAHRNCLASSCGTPPFGEALRTYRRAEQARNGTGSSAQFCTAALEFDRGIQQAYREHSIGDTIELARFYFAQALDRCGYETIAVQVLLDIERTVSQDLQCPGPHPDLEATLMLLSAVRHAAADLQEHVHRTDDAFAEYLALAGDVRVAMAYQDFPRRVEAFARLLDLAVDLDRMDEVRNLCAALLAHPDGSVDATELAFLRSLVPLPDGTCASPVVLPEVRDDAPRSEVVRVRAAALRALATQHHCVPSRRGGDERLQTGALQPDPTR